MMAMGSVLDNRHPSGCHWKYDIENIHICGPARGWTCFRNSMVHRRTCPSHFAVEILWVVLYVLQPLTVQRPPESGLVSHPTLKELTCKLFAIFWGNLTPGNSSPGLHTFLDRPFFPSPLEIFFYIMQKCKNYLLCNMMHVLDNYLTTFIFPPEDMVVQF